ncbi:PREDICTED: histone-lysine N-methyltransferase, H3 lysine-79 specific-like isoform X1 [Poecilia mexicana]|uniref:Platelet-derived growth factor (PDGF) family profile domain-containing protein n=1 Tax=Poecilia mexicana TaxID=48701 RepID=A0A3B3WPC4_9TELE|nr:PREDICTED: histone-lysine N-methyltransferase, H3 lysine-79 specific-like isoform X1 [Poecilia mexicana]
MKSWVLLPLLLAALLSARLRLGNAEGDPLPQSLIDLVWDSPISSVEDLKLLLQQQESSTIEDKEDEHDSLLSPIHGRYIRSLEAQQAQKAECKVRTEVMEITRSMVDRSNANFLVWPQCVEVQRCSGCCNSRHLQCVPVVNATRNLKVTKIVYRNQRRFNEDVIIPVVDHVSCRLQATPPSTSSSSSSSTVFASQPNPLPPPPQRHPASSLPLFPPHNPHPLPPKTPTSKADLHRHDDLKHNQHHHLPHKQDPLARQWQQGSYTQLVRWTQPRVHQAPTYAQTRLTTAGFLGSVGTWPSEARAEHSVLESPQQVGHGSGFDRSREETGGEAHRPDHEQRQQELLKHQQRQEHHHPHHHQHQHPHLSQQYNPRGHEDQEMRTQYLLHGPQSDSASPPVSITPVPTTGQNPTSFTTVNQKDSVTSQMNGEVTRHKQVESKGDGPKDGTKREESGSAVSGDSDRAEAANQEKENDSKSSGGADHLTEEERRKKLLEMVQSEPDKDPLLHPHQRPKPTTFKSALSTVVPASTAARHVPFRPASPRRRKRKHRKRISKAAMRAMIM